MTIPKKYNSKLYRKKLLKFERLAEKLKEAGISEKQADELTFHLLEISYFVNGFELWIKKINRCKKTKKDKIKDLLEDLWGELENHIINNHLIPAKEVLFKILFDKKASN